MSKPDPFDGMLSELCVGMGYCGSSISVTELLPTTGQMTSHKFAELVLIAEHADVNDGPTGTEEYHEHFQPIKAVFEKHFGSDPVRVELLKHQARARN